MAPPLEDVRPKFELKNRSYIVTGGAQGIGFACARAICEMGSNVVIMDIQDQPVEEYKGLSSKFGVRTEYIKTDVTIKESLNSSFAKAIEILGSLDGLVPCAGIAIDKPFTEQTWAEMTRIQELNVRGVFFSELIASQCAHVAIPGYRMAAYNASKGAVRMLAKALAVELAKWKIRVNTISPGFIDLDMTKAVRDLKNAIEGEQMWKSPPLKRIGTQNDLTGAIIYLLSDASSYTTAVDIPIDGGVQAGRIYVEN
ncbi:NAD(P)-binding protein [Mollisia scopiformis]|uniref:NAD(P)-binding protein n=1 Tax=Mollisia scopiformis TaxID=149040 RepID=A0A194XBQ8_MOLSC|nr:NAD(P)-binding protein [Mollisia scopiformis]KUJ17601.1 NAD(P)-binding protein [Mollisia scopiformis]